MTKIQNSDTKCPYCAVQLKAVQLSKGFFYVCPVCEPVQHVDNTNLSGGKRRTSDQINDIRTKIHFYV